MAKAGAVGGNAQPPGCASPSLLPSRSDVADPLLLWIQKDQSRAQRLKVHVLALRNSARDEPRDRWHMGKGVSRRRGRAGGVPVHFSPLISGVRSGCALHGGIEHATRNAGMAMSRGERSRRRAADRRGRIAARRRDTGDAATAATARIWRLWPALGLRGPPAPLAMRRARWDRWTRCDRRRANAAFRGGRENSGSARCSTHDCGR